MFFLSKELREHLLDQRYRISRDGQRLTVTGAETDDIGDYICEARNLAGVKRKEFDIDVHGMCLSQFVTHNTPANYKDDVIN